MSRPPMPRSVRALWALYPRDFRRRHEEDLEMLVDRRLESEPIPPSARRAALIRILCDLLLNLPLEWISPNSPTSRTESPTMQGLGKDFEHALRRSTRNLGSTAVAVLSLGVAIALCTVVFAMLRTTVLDPLPFDEADRLVVLWEERKGEEVSIAWPNFVDWSEGVESAEMAAFRRRTLNLVGDGDAVRVRGLQITDNLFRVLRITPDLGRIPSVGEREVLLTHHLWTERYGQSGTIVGRTMQLDGEPWQIVGVLPPQIDFPSGLVLGRSDLYLPLDPGASADFLDRGSHPGIYAVARLEPGKNMSTLAAELGTVAERLQRDFPASNEQSTVHLEPAEAVAAGDLRLPLLSLFGAVLLLLLAAVGNVSSLLLSDTMARHGEWSLRQALGASRFDVLRQVFAEAAVLTTAATVAGLGLAQVLIRFSGRWPVLRDLELSTSLSGRDAGFSLALGAVAGLAITGAHLVAALRTARARATQNRVTATLRSQEFLVGGQIALATLVLFCAAILTHTMVRIQQQDGGLEPQDRWIFRVSLPDGEQATPEATDAFYSALRYRLEAIPRVVSASGISTMPFSGYGSQSRFEAADLPELDPVRTDVAVVFDGYFETAGVELLAGRALRPTDDERSPIVAVVDERFAQRFWGDDDPIGRRVSGWGFEDMEIVGVVRHVKNYGVTKDSREELFVAHRQRPFLAMWLMVRTETGTHDLEPTLRAAVADIDPNLPISSISSLPQLVQSTVSSVRLATNLGLFLAAVTVLLALIGLRATITHTVQLRMREFGVRLALGSTASGVRLQVLGRSIRVAIGGAVVGVAASLLVASSMERLIFGVHRLDPWSYTTALIVILGMALLAGDGPARRAARCDAALALRED